MKKIMITFISGYFAVLIMGLLFYRFEIFNVHSPAFQFVEAGFIGALLYPLNLYLEKREIYSFTFLIVFLHFIVFIPPYFSWFIRDLVYLAAIITTIMLYVNLIIPVISVRFKKLKIIALAVVYGLVSLAAFLLLSLLLYLFFDFTHFNFTEALFIWIKSGLLIGLGLSIGFNFAEMIINNYLNENKK